jgi:exopolyphosphatase / guanosine-5'-triphosphate,3'-diphosphate pyrophosphatase
LIKQKEYFATENQPLHRIAALDIGSLTLRLAIAQVEQGTGEYRIIHRGRVITRLGQDLNETGMITPGLMERSLEVLSGFTQEIRQHKVSRINAVATQAVRQARNRRDFLSRINRQLGLEVEVLAPEEEARLSLNGVLSVLDAKINGYRPLIVFDVGGGSTEWAFLYPGQAPIFASLPLGALTLTQEFLRGDPPTLSSRTALQAEIQGRLHQLPEKPCPAGSETLSVLVGTAGTITTLAAMSLEMSDYKPQRVNNLVLSQSIINGLASRIIMLPENERAGLPGLETGKAGVMVAGVLIIQEIMRFFQQEELIVVDGGLLEGILQRLATEILMISEKVQNPFVPGGEGIRVRDDKSA